MSLWSSSCLSSAGCTATSPLLSSGAATHAEDDGMKAVNAEDMAVETSQQDEAEMVQKISSHSD